MSYFNLKGKNPDKAVHQMWLRDIKAYSMSGVLKRYSKFLESGLVELHEDEKPREILMDEIMVYSASFIFTPPKPVHYISLDFTLDQNNKNK